MNIFRILGVIAGLIVGFLYLILAYIFIGWGWSDTLPAGWSPLQWVLTILFASIPFLFTFWIVYRCFCRDEMEQVDVLSWTLRPQALQRAFLSELVTLVGGALIIFLVLQRGKVEALSARVLLEPQTPLAEIRDTGEKPVLPISIEAVGIEEADGKFTPVMFLTWPQAGYNYKTFTTDLKAGTPRLKIYRGTNELAASNHFLGEFQIEGYRKTKSSLEGMVFFMLSEKRQLFVEAHEAEHNSYLKLKRTGQ
ncbi:MAG: hypothetical protein JWM68_1443 [Verrucomicrobiales bacterium]|nr:hypothetical protein [Verrucomicrobiales bacterium]